MLVTLRKIVAVGAIAFLAVLGGTATASAQSNTPNILPHSAAETAPFLMQMQGTFRCIDDSDFGFRTNDCNSSNYQHWVMDYYSDGSAQFLNLGTGRCIDDSDFGFRTNKCNGSVFQRWHINFDPGPNPQTFQLQSVATLRCIDDSDFGFRTNSRCNVTPYQTIQWYFNA